MSVTWKLDGLYKADAEKVATELECLGEQYSLADVVNRARDENSEMHTIFEWDDSVAGQKYREHQAATMIRQLVLTKEENGEQKKTNVRFMVSTGNRDNTYTPIKCILRNQNEYEAMLERAMSELRAFKKKYSSLSELEEIFALID